MHPTRRHLTRITLATGAAALALSMATSAVFAGEITGPLVHLYYDWCGEGHADVDFAFTG